MIAGSLALGGLLVFLGRVLVGSDVVHLSDHVTVGHDGVSVSGQVAVLSGFGVFHFRVVDLDRVLRWFQPFVQLLFPVLSNAETILGISQISFIWAFMGFFSMRCVLAEVLQQQCSALLLASIHTLMSPSAATLQGKERLVHSSQRENLSEFQHILGQPTKAFDRLFWVQTSKIQDSQMPTK